MIVWPFLGGCLLGALVGLADLLLLRLAYPREEELRLPDRDRRREVPDKRVDPQSPGAGRIPRTLVRTARASATAKSSKRPAQPPRRR